jgi:XRE family transcriptional regulator, stress-response regulator
MALLRGVIGAALRRARTGQGKTLKAVADDARVSVQYLSEVERGRKEASSEILAAICAALGWTIVDLLDAVRTELVGGPVAQLDAAVEMVPPARPVAGFGREVAPMSGAGMSGVQARLAA